MKSEQLQKKIKDLKILKNKIVESINSQDYILAQDLLKEYEEIFPFDVANCTIKAMLYAANNELKAAREILLIGLGECVFNYDINFSLGVIYQFEENFNESLQYYGKSLQYATNEQEKKTSTEAVENLVNIVMEQQPQKIKEIKNKLTEVQSKLGENDPRIFPLGSDGKSLVGKFISKKQENGHYVNMYKSVMYTDIVPQLSKLFKTETLYGRMFSKKAKVDISEDVVIPLSVMNNKTDITINLNDKEYLINKLLPNSFHYFPIREHGKLTINGNDSFFMGKPIRLKEKENKSTPKLVLYLFIDGLSQETVQGPMLKKLMPKTYDFFQDGAIFNNCYCSAEWTLPSLPTFFTGNYTTRHKLFHPSYIYSIGEKEVLLSEIFQDNGYLVTQICNNWRKTPLYGYLKGFDRIIFQPAVEGMECEEVIMEAIDHLEAFSERKNFLWLTIEDLHKVPDNLEPKVSSQIRNSLATRTIAHDTNETVFKSFDDKKIERYETEIKQIDFYLGMLYEYITSMYSEEEVLVLLISDHGQTFLKEDSSYFHEGRTRVPLLIKGKDIKKSEVEHIIENIDVLPTTLHLANLDHGLDIDGRLPKCFGGKEDKQYAYTESIYPGQTYKAVINDLTHRFMFESNHFVENDGRIDIEGFTVKLLNKVSYAEESKIYFEKVEKYLTVVYEHIKKIIKI
ncbi:MULTISPECIES: sulfatase-like hydrolase/transferase [Pelosinus]|uniref:Sulfatase n=1 Tax=Pelosinus fermentans B4 TaxID=1149862 RepID=I8RP55_9FIRM|nr:MULTISPECIES: sulfatase-like hydrolase/transferase [Pelosinus]EIW20930.1 sulfatase [Pelosinus fermentans B4]EIW27203.1 sulfatase [Pelosinus fermentans A11]